MTADPSYAPAYDERARLHLAREERQLAGSDLATAISLDPHDIDAYRALAGLDLAAGDFDKTETEVKQAIRDNPGDPSALFLRAMLASARGRHEDALRDAETRDQRTGRSRPVGPPGHPPQPLAAT